MAQTSQAEGLHLPGPIPRTKVAAAALLVEPAPMGKRRSRDVKDDPFLACALASRAEFIVTKDRDLLALDKPFGVEIVTPRPFYRRLSSVAT